MERTTIKYIIRSLVILETKWNALLNKIVWWVNVPGPLGIVHTERKEGVPNCSHHDKASLCPQ